MHISCKWASKISQSILPTLVGGEQEGLEARAVALPVIYQSVRIDLGQLKVRMSAGDVMI